MKEGKKPMGEKYDSLPENAHPTECDECTGTLTKLETCTGQIFSSGNNQWFYMYWVCVCSKCSRKVLVYEDLCKVFHQTSTRKYFDRSEISGR